MSLVRTGIVLSAVIALLPSDPASREALYARTSQLAHEAMTYCDRNAQTCRKAAEVWDDLSDKAVFAAGLAGDLVVRYGQLSQDEAARDASLGTLTQADLEPAWRGRK
jgi:hypothetical protein